MKKIYLLIPALLSGAIAATGQITLSQVNDTFESASVAGNVATSQLTWNNYTAGPTLSIQQFNSSNNLQLAVGGQGFRGVYAITPGAPVTLGIGESVGITYDLRFTATPQDNGAAIRVGLYNSNATASAADAFGYLGRFGSGTNTTVDGAKESGTNGTVLGGSDVVAMSGSGVAITAINHTNMTNLGITLTRTGASSILVSLFQEGNLVWSGTDASASNFSFDMIAIGTGTNTRNYQIDNVAAIPEPSTYGFLMAAAVAMGVVYRRRRVSNR